VAPIAIITVLFLPFIHLFYKKRVVGPIVLLTACFYLHYGLSFMLIATVFAAACCYRHYRQVYLKNACVIFATALLLFIPWLVRMATFRNYFFHTSKSCQLGALDMFSLSINFAEIFLNLNVVVWGFALVGLILCFKKKREDFKYCLLAASCLSYFAFLFLFWGVRFNAHMPIVMAPLAGLGACFMLRRMCQLPSSFLKKLSFFVFGCVLIGTIFFEGHILTPSLIKKCKIDIDFMKLKKQAVFFRPTPLMNELVSALTQSPLKNKHEIRVQNLFNAQDVALLLKHIRTDVPANEIIHISNGALADYIVLQTDHKTDWGMYWEVFSPDMKRVLDMRSCRGVYISVLKNFEDLVPWSYVRRKKFPVAYVRIGRYYVGYLPARPRPERIDRAPEL
jgi:hypothetical protein